MSAGPAGVMDPTRPPPNPEVKYRRGDPARRRRSAERAGVSLGVSATFLGLLFVQGAYGAPSDVAPGGSIGGSDNGADGDAALSGSSSAAAFAQGSTILLPGGALTGSTFAVAGLTEIVATAPLIGGAVASSAAIPMPAGAGSSDGSGTPSAPLGPVELTAPAMTAFDLGTMASAPSGNDEDLGDVGRYEQGGNGDDTLIGTDNDDHLDGGAGNDSIAGGAGNDSLLGGDGDDSVDGGTGNDSIDGGNGNDSLVGGAGDDEVTGGSGNDDVGGGSGNDTVGGGDGDDRVDGGTGIDTMFGGSGKDILIVDHLHDLAFEGGLGADDGGIDTLQIGQGYAGSLAAALPQIAPQGLATFVLGSDVGLALPASVNPYVQQVHPYIENLRLTGAAAHDAVGDGRDNRFLGNEADNRLYGGGGDDWLDGGAGDDWLVGGAGEDLMVGSDGNDTFVLNLSDRALDTVWDTSGSNGLRLTNGEAERLAAEVDGDDLRLIYDGEDLAIIRDYVGHEANFSGIDFGDGPQSLADFVAAKDMLAEFLPRTGSETADVMQADSGGEWLEGKGGNDTLVGKEGVDTLDGGNGSDVLRGGAGDDHYLVRSGDIGIDRISDPSGRSTAELADNAGQKLGAFLLGQDLWVTVDDRPFLVVEGHGAHPDAFAGVKAGDKVIDPNELLT